MIRRNASLVAGALGLLSFDGRRPGGGGENDALVRRANQILDLRRRRIEQFGKDMFGEPAWDILLAIYVHEHRGNCSTIAELTRVAGVAPSVALRWLNFLISEGHVERNVHPANLDAVLFQLTGNSRETLERYLTETFT
jgi:DNA-binding MarR family transcriptional regulator